MNVVSGRRIKLNTTAGDIDYLVYKLDGKFADNMTDPITIFMSKSIKKTFNQTVGGEAVVVRNKLNDGKNSLSFASNMLITTFTKGRLNPNMTCTTYGIYDEISYTNIGAVYGGYIYEDADGVVFFSNPMYGGLIIGSTWPGSDFVNVTYSSETSFGIINVSFNENVDSSTTIKPTQDDLEKSQKLFKLMGYSSKDPYESGGTSGTGGGGGDFSDQSDDIDFGSTPNISLGSTGLCNAFSPTKAELTELGSYMWGTLNIENFRRIFADPMDVIIGLSAIPISPQLGSKKEVFVGNIGTGLTMSEITRNFVSLACGSVSLDEYWGAYLDYSPSTTVEIYLPFIGYHKLDTNEVMGRQINLLYQVDVITGSCMAQVMTIDKENHYKVIATYQGNCGYQLPISGTNWASMFGSALGMVGTAAVAIGSGGTALPLVAPALASTALNASKDDITRSGSIGGNPVLGMPKTPYLIITRPNQALPEGQNKYMGYPSFITVTLSELEGYTEFESIHLEGIPATDDELTELETMLKEGVIF